MSISKENFKKMLKDKGLKVTNQRLLVLEVLADHRDKHMTAEDIYELVKEDYPEIGLATIYRTVQLLREMQLVDRINLDDGCLRYEISDFLSMLSVGGDNGFKLTRGESAALAGIMEEFLKAEGRRICD